MSEADPESIGLLQDAARRPVQFDPLQLCPEASLNRTRLAALPGADARWVGRPAMELLSLEALHRLASEFGLGDDLFRASQTTDVVDVFGRRLGHLVATLTSPPTPPAGDQSPWRVAYLEHWAQIRHVWLGGGIAAALGDRLAAAARAELARLGQDACHVEVAAHPGALALLGAARSRPRAARQAVVFDFGHTAVKRGIATFGDGCLRGLELLPSVAATQDWQATALVLETVEQTVREVEQRREIDPRVVISLATYLSGAPGPATHDFYGPLRVGDLPVLRNQLGRRLELVFLHDGTAAAQGVPERQRAAVIGLGTWLSVGFPPGPDVLLPVASDLAIVETAPS